MTYRQRMDRLCYRFEIAVANFGRSCIDMSANEKAFQAWYTAGLVQEFGLARVYREVHLWKPDMRKLIGKRALTDSLLERCELFPDVSVSWEDDLDARDSRSRLPLAIRNAGGMLHELAIISEFKATGSTSVPTSPGMIQRDLLKLHAFSEAHLKYEEKRVSSPARRRPLCCYMVILDNATKYDKKKKIQSWACSYTREKVERLVKPLAKQWGQNVPKPTIIVIRSGELFCICDILADFKDWDEEKDPLADGAE